MSLSVLCAFIITSDQREDEKMIGCYATPQNKHNLDMQHVFGIAGHGPRRPRRHVRPRHAARLQARRQVGRQEEDKVNAKEICRGWLYRHPCQLGRGIWWMPMMLRGRRKSTCRTVYAQKTPQLAPGDGSSGTPLGMVGESGRGRRCRNLNDCF